MFTLESVIKRGNKKKLLKGDNDMTQFFCCSSSSSVSPTFSANRLHYCREPTFTLMVKNHTNKERELHNFAIKRSSFFLILYSYYCNITTILRRSYFSKNMSMCVPLTFIYVCVLLGFFPFEG